MTILSCLLRWLLPPLTCFSISIALFFYFYGHSGIFDAPESFTLAIAICSALVLIGAVFFVVNTISKPIRHLKDAALDIAAGDFRTVTIPVKAPQEIADLADALHTMGECVQDSINKMNQNAALRERLQGEYECALLLQRHMLQEVIEDFSNDHLLLRHIAYRSTTTPHGLLLKIDTPKPDEVTLKLYESAESGFSGMYNVLLNPAQCTQHLKVDFKPKEHLLKYEAVNMPKPLIWSIQQEKFISSHSPLKIEPGILVFLYNREFEKYFDTPAQVQDWFHKVLRHFAIEGMELFVTMLNCEVNFLTRKHHVDHDINIICMQLL